MTMSVQSAPRFTRSDIQTCLHHANLTGSGPLTADTIKFSGNYKLIPPFQLQSALPYPLLGPNPAHVWESRGVFNPAVVPDGKGGAHILYRAVDGTTYPELPFINRWGYAHTPDGLHIDYRSPTPILEPLKGEEYKKLGWERNYEAFGCEDPRITKIDDTYFIVYTAFDGKQPNTCLITTQDFKHFERHGKIGPDTHSKDAFFLPTRVNGKLMLFHREPPDIQYVLADSVEQLKDPKFWAEQMKPEVLAQHTLMKRRPSSWENKIGGGIPPIETQEGWLFIYHGLNSEAPGRRYCGAVALLDKKDPTKIIARCPYPLMEPTQTFEKRGHVDDVVYPQGYSQRGDKLFIYYGAADKFVGVTQTSMSKLLKYVKQFDAVGNPVPTITKSRLQRFLGFLAESLRTFWKSLMALPGKMAHGLKRLFRQA